MTNSKSFTRYFPAIARILLGLPLLASGFFWDSEYDATTHDASGRGRDGVCRSADEVRIHASADLHHAVHCGLLLVINRLVPLALVLFAPFIVNAMAFHIFLEHTGLPIAAVFLLLELYLAWQYRRYFVSVLTVKATAGNN